MVIFKSMMHMLNIPNNSYGCSYFKAMNDILESHFSGTDYEPVLKDHAGPQKRKLYILVVKGGIVTL